MRVGAWQFRKLCPSLTKQCRHDEVRHAGGHRFFGGMAGDDLQVGPYLARTNASFLLGDKLNSLTGCNTLVSLHPQPGPHNRENERKSYTYVSHSIKEFFDNIQKVPENFTNQSAFHLCMDPQVQWVRLGEHAATVHDHPELFKPQRGSGPDALAKEIIANITHADMRGAYLYLGDPISAGYVTCAQPRFDWEQGKQMHNLSKVNGIFGTNMTKQWLKINNSDSITKLSMVCNQFFDYTAGSRRLPDDAYDAGVTLFSDYLHMQVLFALFVASLIVSCV